MARLPRPDFAGIPQHVVQQGNNRLPCFVDDEGRQRYLQYLSAALSRFQRRLHACALMDNHVHLLLTPDEAGGVSRLMHTYGLCSIDATDTPARCGKDATRHAWSIRRGISWPAAGTSNSTPCAHGSPPNRGIILGQVTAPTPVACSIRC